MGMLIRAKCGPVVQADGGENEVRTDKQGALVATDAHGRYHEATYRGNVFTANAAALTLAAGNIAGASAAASSNFVVYNPIGSGKIMSILQCQFAYRSGTPAAGAVYYGYVNAGGVALASTAAINCLYQPAPSASAMRFIASAGGTAFTGGLAPATLRIANFAQSAIATPGAAVLGVQPTIDPIEGGIVIGAGYGFLPLLAGAGTTQIYDFGVIWEELPA